MFKYYVNIFWNISLVVKDRHKDKTDQNNYHNNYNKYYICRLWTVIDIFEGRRWEEVFEYYMSTFNLYRYEGGLKNVDMN